MTAGKISGSFFWTPAVDESNVEGYKLYLLDESDIKIQPLNTIQKGTNSCTISDSIDVSNGYKLGIFAYNEGGEETTGAKLTILDRYPHFSGATWSYSDFLLRLSIQYTPTGSGFDLTKLVYCSQSGSTFKLQGTYTQVYSQNDVDGSGNSNWGRYYFDNGNNKLCINLTEADYNAILNLPDNVITGAGSNTEDTVSAELGWCITSGVNAPAVAAKVVTGIY